MQDKVDHKTRQSKGKDSEPCTRQVKAKTKGSVEHKKRQRRGKIQGRPQGKTMQRKRKDRPQGKTVQRQRQARSQGKSKQKHKNVDHKKRQCKTR